MAHKHKYLHELLQEDQEPFHLKNYIEHRRCQLKRPPSSNTHSSLKKPDLEFSLCKNVCFFFNSHNPTKSPLFEFTSPPKQALKDPNTNSSSIFLHVSPKTSALLLEAALRIQNETSESDSPKTKAPKRNNVVDGLLGSILKRLSHRNQNRNRIRSRKGNVLYDSVMWVLATGGRKSFEKGDGSCCTSSSSSSSEFVDVEEVCSVSNGDFVGKEEKLCASPFRFVLQGSPPSGHRTPELSSPPTSRHENENKETYDGNCLKKFLIAAEEEEREQCSPVSTLDPPFDDDVDGKDHADKGEGESEDEDSFDYEDSYTIVQRAKQQLLNKLYRFEKLAELDPIELEKRIQELDGDNSEAADDKQEDEIEDDETLVSDEEFVSKVIRSAFVHSSKFPKHRIKLVSDLISDEESELNCNDEDALVKRVCQKLESWKKGHCSTIQMMVDKDLRDEFDWWKKNLEKTEDVALEIEQAIFGLLMEELSADLAG